MSRSYACIISPDAARDKHVLAVIAREFSYSIEMLDDGILFDVSGLERLIGSGDQIAEKISEQLNKQNIGGSIAVADTLDTAMLLARKKKAGAGDTRQIVHSPDTFQDLPLDDLAIEPGTLKVFSDLGIRHVRDLLDIPRDDLVMRYGREFEQVIKKIEQKAELPLTPNVKETQAAWGYELDLAVEDFEQLIFILNHGLDRLFEQVSHSGFSTEHLDISFRLQNKGTRDYEIKTSFPTLDKTFWLKLINLRVSMDPPESGIVSLGVKAHFTRARPVQKGLYAVSRPEPESLLLTVNKLKKLVGDENVGVPVIVDQRLAAAFALDAAKMPAGVERVELSKKDTPIIAFTYFRPPVTAEVLVRHKQLIFVKTQHMSGHVTEYSGVWKANSKWWDQSWKTQEWDVEIENNGVYRLCKVDKNWFLAGEYD